jgi:hypothetical protein
MKEKIVQLSVIIPVYGDKLISPTINSIKSLLLQITNYNFEIIISNNGRDPNVKETICSLFTESIKYIEPPTFLPMTMHFEWASKSGSGKYVMVLPARRFLKQYSIQKLISIMESNSDCSICSCSYDEWDDETSRLLINTLPELKGIVSTSLIIDKFLNKNFNSRSEFWSTLPTSMNGIVRRDFMDKMRSLYCEDYFNSFAPDLSSGFKCLFNLEKIYIINESLFVTTNRNVSNGNYEVISFEQKYAKALGEEGIYKYLPYSFRSSSYASLIEDFNRQNFLYHKFINSNDFSIKYSKYYLKEITFEFFLKLLNNKICLINFIHVCQATYSLYKLGISLGTFIKKLLLAIVATIYLKSNGRLRFFLLLIKGKSIKYNNIYEACNF